MTKTALSIFCLSLAFWGISIIDVASAKENESIRIVHHNIKEFDSTKLISYNDQVSAAAEIQKILAGDLVSVNEIQYDLPNVPNSTFQSTGENLKKFGMQFISTPFQSAIRPANTGMNAKKLPDGSYTTNTNHPDWLKLADHDNFGLFPAEYSSGLISKFPILNLNVISDLKWKDFDPSFDPAAFKDARGLPYRRDLELFDKNFMDVTIVIGATPVHVIILHTVPAFNFGNPNGLNELRNAAQLRFLKYYLTGVVSKTDQPIVKSLNPGEAFIAMGDWNVDRDNSELEGAVVLKELGALFQYWIKDRVITYESQNYSPDRFSSQLDYILLSPHFDIVDSGVFRNENRIEKGCDGEPNDQKEGWKVVSYPSGEKTCYALVPDEMVLSKTASDHFAIFAEVTLKP